MTLRCKAGDTAVVLHDTPECASNIGRFVRILGSLEFSGNLGKWCWLIVPVGSGLWMVERGGRVSPETVTNRSRVEHPDDWLKPIPPDVLDKDAERAREKLDAWLLNLRTPAADARKTAQITT